MNKNILLSALLAATASMMLASAANAALSVQVSSGMSTITATDGDSDGMASISSSIEGWSVSTTGYGTSFLGGNLYSDMLDLFSFEATSTAPGDDLTVMLTETDMSMLNAPWVAAVGGTTGGVVSFQSYVDAGNGAFTLTTDMSDTGWMSGPGFSDVDRGSLSMSGPYSWTIVATISHASDRLAMTSFDYNVNIPEPGSLALLGIGMLGLGLASARRRKKGLDA